MKIAYTRPGDPEGTWIDLGGEWWMRPPESAEIVEKKWGIEAIIVNQKDPSYCSKLLYIRAGNQTSIHRHVRKDEHMLCLPSGLVDIRTGLDLAPRTLMPGQGLRIPAGQIHRIHAWMNSIVLETSTFHSDDDVQRYTDEELQLATSTMPNTYVAEDVRMGLSVLSVRVALAIRREGSYISPRMRSLLRSLQKELADHFSHLGYVARLSDGPYGI